MGTATNQLSVQDLHRLVIGRIYHEDQLFAQRTYVLASIQAFFVTASAFLFEHQTFLTALLTILGAGLAIFQALYGRQANRAIGFWREYARLIERAEIKFDHLQYDFYRLGKAHTDFGEITKGNKGKSVYEIFRWHDHFWTKSTGVLGMLFPIGLAVFWTSMLLVIIHPKIMNLVNRLPQQITFALVLHLAPFALLAVLLWWAIGRRLAVAEGVPTPELHSAQQ